MRESSFGPVDFTVNIPEHSTRRDSTEGSIQSTVFLWPLLAAVFLAVCLWGWTFGLTGGNFWAKLSISAASLMMYSLWFNRRELPQLFDASWRVLASGVGSAAILYGIFWVGGVLLRAVFSGSGHMIGAVYATKAALPTWGIALLLIFLIGPAEEIFWRGFVQDRLVGAMSPAFGVPLASVVYALVHLWSGNPVLVLAAFVCGLVWGRQYLKNGTLTGVIVSHVLWDVAVFVVAPLG